MDLPRANAADEISRPRLEARKLRRSLLHVDHLVLAPGEVRGLAGPSGAGKTLLLRALADLDPHEGDLFLDGREHREITAPQWRRQVAYVAAETAWWAESVGHHFERWPEALAQRLGFAPEAEGWSVQRLSTGERQRLALLRTLGLDPRVLLLDEPTSALDADNARRVEELILDLVRRSGVSVLWVAHDPAQLERVADRRLRIDAGRLLEGGPW